MSGMVLRWQIAILKILAAQRNGEAPTSVIARDLSILMGMKDGPATQQTFVRSMPSRAIFADGLIERPEKGMWRISQAGRDYLQGMEFPIGEAAE